MRKVKSFYFLCFAVSFLFFTQNRCFAQECYDEKSFSVTMESRALYMCNSGVKSMNGDVKIIDTEDSVKFSFKLFEELPVEISLGGRHISLNEDVAVSLPSSLTAVTTDIDTKLPFFNLLDTYLGLGISPSMYTDDWGFDSGAFRLPSRAYLIYKPNEQWTFVAGAAYMPEYELEVTPIVGFIYKPNEEWTFNFVPPRPTIEYKLNEMFTFFTEGGITSEEFEVTRDGVEGVVLCYNNYRVGSGVNVSVTENLKVSLALGGVFGQSLVYRDKIGKVNLEDGMYTEAKVELLF